MMTTIILKASLLVGLAIVVQMVLHRRTSAATRHFIWTLTIAGLIVLPIASIAVPSWSVIIRTAAPDREATAVAVHDGLAGPADPAPASRQSAPVAPIAEPSAPVSWWTAIGTLYAAGLVLLLLRLVMQQRHVRRLARESTAVHDAAWRVLIGECARSLGVRRPVALLRSRANAMPMALGTRRPAILIPATADAWPDDRRRAVILHELAHVARFDCLTQTAAFVACAMYWFHPAVWWVARRLRIERELACDDRVLAAGTRARDYAGHLLEIAYSLGGHRAPALAVSMARPRQLEGRMLAVLDAARNRRMPGWRLRLAAAAIASAFLLPLAAVQATLVPAEAELPREDAPAAASNTQDSSAAPQLPGTWEIRPGRTAGTVHLRLGELNSSSSTEVPIERLDGLAAAQLSAAGGPVQFRVRRDAGTFTFEGVIRSGVGAGTFSFAPDPGFPAALAKRGFAGPTPKQQYQLARHDVGFAFLDELNRQGYTKPDLAELVRAAQHGVQPDYLREMGALGYRLGSLAALVKLRDHGVTPGYIRDLAEQGYKGLAADELLRARDHGISAEYVRAMRDAGYGSLPMAQLIKARDHGVTAEFVQGLAKAGHRNLPLDQVIRVRDHGVTVEFITTMAALGYPNLPIETLVRMRDHGVTEEYVKELKALGYDRLSVDDLVMLRDHGFTADRIRAANARAGTRLPIDLLKSMR